MKLQVAAVMLFGSVSLAQTQDTLWLGNDHGGKELVPVDVFQTDTRGNVLRTVRSTFVTGIAWDGQFLYFGDQGGNITKRSADGATVISSFSVGPTGGRPCEDMAWDSKRRRLWRVDTPNWLVRIDPVQGIADATYQIPPPEPGAEVYGLAYNSTEDVLYVSFLGDEDINGFVEIVNPATGTRTGRLFASTDLTVGLAYDPATGTLWVGSDAEIYTWGGPVKIRFPRPQPTGPFADGLEFVPGSATPPPPAAPETTANQPNAAAAGDPVSTATGEVYDTETDLTLGGPLPLTFTRYYASFLTAGGVTSALGTNWMHNFDVRLAVSGTSATVTLFRGKRIKFVQSGGTWKLDSTEKLVYQFASVADGYRFLDPAENRIYGFSGAGTLLKIEDRNGNALAVTQAASGPDEVSDGLGRTLKFIYTAGKLTRVQDQAGRSVSFAYTGNNLTGATDANGKTATYSYTGAGLLVSKTFPLGNKPFTQEFDAAGRVVKQTDSRGNPTAIEYDKPSAGATTVRDALGSTYQHIHKGGNLTGYIDPAGQGVVIQYDAANRRSVYADRLGDKSTITYHEPSGRVATYTDAAGNTTSYSYTAQVQGPFTFYNLSRVTCSDGTSTAITHDASGNPASVTDQAGKRWAYTYNSRGQTVTVTTPAGEVTRFSYNTDATMASITYPSGRRTSFAYDNRKRMIEMREADQTLRQFTYDEQNHLTRFTDERGNVRSLSYDENGQLRSATNAENKTATFAYDGNGRLSAIFNPAGKSIPFEFDAMGRPKTITTRTGEPINFAFDTLNRLTSVSDCSGKGVSFGYDKEGVVSALTDGLGQTWSFSSDKKGRLTGFRSSLGRTSAFTYDPLGRLLTSTDALSRTTTHRRDSRGLITETALPGGITASFTRDDLGRITAITDPNGNVWKWSYDAQGRLASITDPLSRATSYSYDARDRISIATFPEGSVRYTYDAASNVTRRLYSDGLDLNHAYDTSNRLVRADGITLVHAAPGGVVASNGLVISRDDSGRISAITYAPGKSVRYNYDCRGLLAGVVDWAGGSTRLTYDGARQLLSIERPNGVSTRYTYDRDGRLTAITETKGAELSSIVLERNAAGYVTSEERSTPLAPAPASGVVEFSYDAAGQRVDGKYDKLGRPASLGTRTYTWDLASRLNSYQGADGAASFTYDANGLRISRTAGGTTQNYVWNYGTGRTAVSVVRDGGTDRVYYIHLPGGTLLYSLDAADNSRRFYHFDEMGSTIFLTDDNGAISDSYAIAPYGEEVGRSGSTANPFTFLGAYGVMQEGNTGLYYMGERYYDSATGRFLSRDLLPGLDPRDLNQYQYARANPLFYVDPQRQGGRTMSVGSRSEGSVLPRLLFRVQERVAESGGPGNEKVLRDLLGPLLESLTGISR